MEDIKQQIIRQKLTLIKQLVAKDKNGDLFIIINREKNLEFIHKYGLIIDDIKEIMLNLEINDYYKGPEEDEAGYEGEVWIFTPKFQDIRLYIKIRIKNNILIVCISIHEYGVFY